jgi:hypothetical protein
MRKIGAPLLFVIIAVTATILACFPVVDGLSSSSSPPPPPPRFLPTSTTALARQAAQSIVTAMFQHDIHRQTIRLPLSESMYRNKAEGFVADRAIGWQGGPQETIRYLCPLATRVLQEISTSRLHPALLGGLVISIQEQVLLDFDGSVLLTAEHPAGAKYDVQAILQPNTDEYYRKTIQTIEAQFSDTPGVATKRLFLIINPAWRNKESWSFWEAGRAEQEILNRYETTYCIDQFVVRGSQISLLFEYGQEWAVFETAMPYQQQQVQQQQQQDKDGNEMDNTKLASRLIGTFPERPTYQELDALIVLRQREQQQQRQQRSNG